jgi:hypothetical protein
LRVVNRSRTAPYGLHQVLIITILPTMPVLAGTTLGRNASTGNSSRERRNSTIAADNAKIAGGRCSVKFPGLIRHMQRAGKIRASATNNRSRTRSSQGGKTYAWGIQDARVRRHGIARKSCRTMSLALRNDASRIPNPFLCEVPRCLPFFYSLA